MAASKGYDLTHSLGLTIDKDGVAGSILWNGPAFRADIVNGTKIVAVDGVAYSKDRLAAAIKAATDGKTPVRLLVERGGRYRAVARSEELRVGTGCVRPGRLRWSPYNQKNKHKKKNE